MPKKPAAPKVTLATIAEELRLMNRQFRQLNATVDDHFQLTKQEFQNVRGDMETFRQETKTDFKRTQRSIETLADQLGKTVSDVDALKRKPKTPSA